MGGAFVTKTIGLTGSISTGKSTVARIFAEQHIPVIDADQLAKEVVEPGQSAYQQIVDTFGTGFLLENQELDRTKLATLIFSDQSKREQLNQIVHPEVIDQMIQKKEDYTKQQAPLIVLEIPLLYENKLTYLVDAVVVVYTTIEKQWERLMERDQLTKAEAKQRIDAQMSIEQKANLADYVIDNNNAHAITVQQAKVLIKQLLQTD